MKSETKNVLFGFVFYVIINDNVVALHKRLQYCCYWCRLFVWLLKSGFYNFFSFSVARCSSNATVNIAIALLIFAFIHQIVYTYTQI